MFRYDDYVITLLYFINLDLGTFYQLSLHIGEDDILQREGEAPNGSLLKAHRFHSVEELGSFAGSGLGKDITDQRSELFFAQGFVHILNLVRQDLVKYYPSCGGFDDFITLYLTIHLLCCRYY